MTTSARILSVLVVALLVFVSQGQNSNTTSAPSNATETPTSNPTSAPSNSTAAPSSAPTSAPNGTTSPSSSPTSAPNGTLAPTSIPVNGTESPSNFSGPPLPFNGTFPPIPTDILPNETFPPFPNGTLPLGSLPNGTWTPGINSFPGSASQAAFWANFSFGSNNNFGSISGNASFNFSFGSNAGGSSFGSLGNLGSFGANYNYSASSFTNETVAYNGSLGSAFGSYNSQTSDFNAQQCHDAISQYATACPGIQRILDSNITGGQLAALCPCLSSEQMNNNADAVYGMYVSCGSAIIEGLSLYSDLMCIQNSQGEYCGLEFDALNNTLSKIGSALGQIPAKPEILSEAVLEAACTECFNLMLVGTFTLFGDLQAYAESGNCDANCQMALAGTSAGLSALSLGDLVCTMNDNMQQTKQKYCFPFVMGALASAGSTCSTMAKADCDRSDACISSTDMLGNFACYNYAQLPTLLTGNAGAPPAASLSALCTNNCYQMITFASLDFITVVLQSIGVSGSGTGSNTAQTGSVSGGMTTMPPSSGSNTGAPLTSPTSAPISGSSTAAPTSPATSKPATQGNSAATVSKHAHVQHRTFHGLQTKAVAQHIRPLSFFPSSNILSAYAAYDTMAVISSLMCLSNLHGYCLSEASSLFTAPKGCSSTEVNAFFSATVMGLSSGCCATLKGVNDGLGCCASTLSDMLSASDPTFIQSPNVQGIASFCKFRLAPQCNPFASAPAPVSGVPMSGSCQWLMANATNTQVLINATAQSIGISPQGITGFVVTDSSGNPCSSSRRTKLRRGARTLAASTGVKGSFSIVARDNTTAQRIANSTQNQSAIIIPAVQKQAAKAQTAAQTAVVASSFPKATSTVAPTATNKTTKAPNATNTPSPSSIIAPTPGGGVTVRVFSFSTAVLAILLAMLL